MLMSNPTANGVHPLDVHPTVVTPHKSISHNTTSSIFMQQPVSFGFMLRAVSWIVYLFIQYFLYVFIQRTVRLMRLFAQYSKKMFAFNTNLCTFSVMLLTNIQTSTKFHITSNFLGSDNLLHSS